MKKEKTTFKDLINQFMGSIKQIIRGITDIIIGIYYIFGCFILLIMILRDKNKEMDKKIEKNKKKNKKSKKNKKNKLNS